ncbi:DUF3108 domain-containing protein [Oxalobacteraceae bacterium]|nr:DUF3108 domain-containing protein [Oxalobacteraceae bacterium]
MTIASFFSQRRRLLLLCAATVALHYLTIDWLGTRLGASERTQRAPAVVSAQLRLALPPRMAATPLPEIAPLEPAQATPARPRKPPAAPRPSTAEIPAEAPAAPEASASAGGGSGAGEGGAPAAAQAGATPAAPVLPSAPPPDTAPATAETAPPAEAPAIPGVRRYKVNLPPSADFALDIKRVDADGTSWSGVAGMSWHSDGSRYKLSVEAGISMLVTRLNLLVLTSEGEIDDYGIAPAKATEKRRGRSETATHFRRDERRITFSATERSYPLLTGSQDKASVLFQLGGIGRADINQMGTPIDIFVGEDKEANIFRFELVGEEEIETAMGRMVTWHLSRPPKPGTYSSRLDVWLAPGRNWYPVQIRNTEANGALTTQTVSKITLTPAGQ